MELNTLKNNAGANKKRMRVGRGIGSGKGKTSGRGVKGQKARTGVRVKGFEGGQMPVYRRLPKQGFTNANAKAFRVVSLADLQAAIDAKKIDAKKELNAAALKEAGIITSVKDGIRVLANGEIKAAINIEVAGASKAAVAAIEKAGGKVTFIAAPTSVEEKKAAAKGKPKAEKKAKSTEGDK